MIRRLLALLGQPVTTAKRILQPPSNDTELTEAKLQASTVLIPKLADRPTPSQDLSNEARVISDVRAHIPQLKALAFQKRLNHLSQWDAYIADIKAPAQPGHFTNLEEENKRLAEQYDEILAEIFEQMCLYDRYCEYHQLNYSTSWRAMLDELNGYLSGLPSAAMYHIDEAYQITKQAKPKS